MTQREKLKKNFAKPIFLTRLQASIDPDSNNKLPRPVFQTQAWQLNQVVDNNVTIRQQSTPESTCHEDT